MKQKTNNFCQVHFVKYEHFLIKYLHLIKCTNALTALFKVTIKRRYSYSKGLKINAIDGL